MNLCTILGHKKTKEKADDKKLSHWRTGETLYMSMIQIKCARCDKVFKTRPEDYRDH